VESLLYSRRTNTPNFVPGFLIALLNRDHAIATCPFCVVELSVGAAQQNFVGFLRSEGCNTEARGHRDRGCFGNRHHRGTQAVADSFGYANGDIERCVGEQNGELLAAKAAHNIMRSAFAPEFLTYRREDPVAGQMSVAIIDHLEMIDIDGDDAQMWIAA
jgi:hypothetical protein